MEKRRSIPVKLLDGKEYLFSERNKEDSDFAALQDRVRKHNMRLIQDSVTVPEERLTLLAAEMRREYSIQMVLTHIMSSTGELLRVAFDSFKIENPGISFEEFHDIFPADDVEILSNLIIQLEGDQKSKLFSEKKKRKGLQIPFLTKLQSRFS
jgi:hypothetical protein